MCVCVCVCMCFINVCVGERAAVCKVGGNRSESLLGTVANGGREGE